MGEYTTVLAVAKVKSRTSIYNNRLREIANNNGCLSADKDQFLTTTNVVKHILLFDTLTKSDGLILKKKIDELTIGNKVDELLFYFIDVDNITRDILEWAFGSDNIIIQSVDDSITDFTGIVNHIMSEHGYAPDDWTAVQIGDKYVKDLLQLVDGFTVFGDEIVTTDYINLNAERDVRAWYAEVMKDSGKTKVAKHARTIMMASEIMLRAITFISEFRKKNRHNMYSFPIEHHHITQTIDDMSYMFIGYACMRSKKQALDAHIFSDQVISHFVKIGEELITHDEMYKYMSLLEYSVASDPFNIIVLYKDIIHDITEENINIIINDLKSNNASLTPELSGISNYREIVMSYMSFINWYFTFTYDAFGPIFKDTIDDYFNSSIQLANNKIDRIAKGIVGFMPM